VHQHQLHRQLSRKIANTVQTQVIELCAMSLELPSLGRSSVFFLWLSEGLCFSPPYCKAGNYQLHSTRFYYLSFYGKSLSVLIDSTRHKSQQRRTLPSAPYKCSLSECVTLLYTINHNRKARYREIVFPTTNPHTR